MAKRAVSAYWLWLGENRALITQKYGLEGKRGSEVTKKAGEVWKAIGPAEKKKYEELAAKDKARYEEEVKVLGKRIRKKKNDKEPKRAKKAKRDKDAPKRPMSAYFLWTQESREAITKKYNLAKTGGPEYTRKAAEEWKQVSDVVRMQYERKAAAAREQYRKDMQAYMKKKQEEGGNAEEEEGEYEEEAEEEEEEEYDEDVA
mmetsp:Transcript_49581/g.148084  ORF Transcript_49581/g.148084 Transcript_49581/m.148084 type:complete len:202 (+) Transcript_49581:58-663(+)